MSKLYEYATDELTRAGLFDYDADYNCKISDDVLTIIKSISEQGHSGESLKIMIEVSLLLRVQMMNGKINLNTDQCFGRTKNVLLFLKTQMEKLLI